MTPHEQYEDLKGEVDDLKKNLAKAQGAEEQMLAALAKEYECKTLEEAEELLSRLDAETKKLQTKRDNLLKEYIDARDRTTSAATE